MHFIYFLTILLYTIVKADDDIIKKKYIDVLPDDKKSIILDKIARRIHEDVSPKDERHKYKGEITDEQLQTHDEFVKNILKEESENLRRGDAKQNEVKSNRDNKSLDLSHSVTETLKTHEVPVDIHYEHSNLKEIINKTRQHESTEDIQIKKNRRNAENINETIKNIDNPEIKGTQMIDFEPEVVEGSEEETADNNTTTETRMEDSTTESIAVTIKETINDITTEDSEQNTQDLNYVTDKVSWSNERNCSDEDSVEKHNNTRKYSDISSDKSHDGIVTEVHINTSDIHSTAFDINDLENVSEVISVLTTSVTELPIISPNLMNATKSTRDLRNKSADRNSVSNFYDLYTTHLPTIKSEINNKAVSSNNENILKTESKKELTPENESDSQRVEIVELGNLGTKESAEDLPTKNRVKTEYLVFEVDEDKPFIKNEKIIDTEQPYYIPIYNYAPNNAYFNAKNRLGPNDETEPNSVSEKELRGSFRFGKDYYVDEEDKNTNRVSGIRQHPKKRYLKQNDSNFLTVKDRLRSEKHHNIENDYDLDKYLRKFGHELPSSSESEHPYHSMGTGKLKSHLSAVRKILFSKALYGSIPEVLDQKSKKKILRAKDNSNDSEDKAISVDYYLGRIRKEIDGDGLKSVGYLRQGNETKNLLIKDLPKSEMNLIHFNNQSFVNTDYQVTPNSLSDYPNYNLTPMKRFFWFFTKKRPKRTTTATTPFVSEEGKLDTITKILNVSDESDVFLNLETLKELKVPIRVGHKRQSDVSAYVTVMTDMVQLDNEGLKNYDWLGSTVDIQAAVNKLANLTDAVILHKDIHPLDLELLKYTIYLHKAAKASPLEESANYSTRSKRKNTKHTNGKLGREDELNDFNEFIDDLLNNFYELHNAIKNIALVTQYEKQNWFKNLKDIYFEDEREVLTAILHLTCTRLFGLIEESTRNGLEHDFIGYILKNEKDTLKTLREFKFVLVLLNEIKDLQYYLLF